MRLVAVSLLLLGCKPRSYNEEGAVAQNARHSAKTFLVPLDDRPSTLLFVRQIARVGGVNLEVPLRAHLGEFLTPGQPLKIADWLRREAKSGDTLFVSSDMIAYGGLVASRMAGATESDAVKRLDVLSELAQRGVRIQLFAILPRLSLKTSKELSAEHEAKIRDWAMKPGAPYPTGVPEKYVKSYLEVRKRNLAVSKKIVSFVDAGFVDTLIFGQDDANATGLHVEEQNELRALISRSKNKDRIRLIQGADEIAMDMVAGWVAKTNKVTPTVRVVYSEKGAESSIPPLESHTLGEMVEDHIRISGARRVEQNADVELFVQVPKSKEPFAPFDASQEPRSEAFAAEMAAAMRSGRRVALADLAIINRADSFLAEAVLKEVPLWKLEAYASWNTPANAFGTAIAQLVVNRVAQSGAIGNNLTTLLESQKTHQAFLFARMVDDYGYQAIFRNEVRKLEKGIPVDPEPLLNLYGPVGLEMRNLLLPWARNLYQTRFLGKEVCLEPLQKAAKLGDLNIEAILPWQRTFEVEALINMKLVPTSESCR